LFIIERKSTANKPCLFVKAICNIKIKIPVRLRTCMDIGGSQVVKNAYY
jgi:hypothetical protein